VLPLPDRFCYYFLDLPFRIQNVATSFQLELEHLISREVSRSTILSGVAGTNVPSLCAFLEILLGNNLEYDSNDIDYNDPPCMCYHIDSEIQPEEALGLTPPD
jgi:hypothetical protein